MKKLLIINLLLVSISQNLYAQELQVGTLRITSPLNRAVFQQSSSENASIGIFAQWLNSGDNIGNAAIRFQYKISTVDKDGNVGGAVSGHDWSFGNFENLTRSYNGGSGESYFKVLKHPNGTINLSSGWYLLEVRVLRTVFLGWRKIAYTSVKFGIGDVYISYGQSNASSYGGDEEPSLINYTTDPSYVQRDAVSVISRNRKDDYKLKGFPIINPDNENAPTSIVSDGFSKLQKQGSNGRIYPAGEYSWCYAPLGDKLLISNNRPVLFLNCAIPGAEIDFLKDVNSWGYKRFRHMLQFYVNILGSRGVIWHQGENNARTQLFGTLDFSNYTDKLKSLIEQSRLDLNTNNLTWNVSKVSYYAFPDQSVSVLERFGDPFAIHNSVPPNNIPSVQLQHSYITGNSYLASNPTHKDFTDYNKSLTDAQANILNQSLSNVRMGISTDDIGLALRGKHRAIHFNGATLSEVAKRWKEAGIDTGTPVDTKPVRSFSSITNTGSNYVLTAPSGFDKYFWVLNDNGIYNPFDENQTITLPLTSSTYKSYTCYLGKSNGQDIGNATNGWNLNFEMTQSFIIPGYQGTKSLAANPSQINFNSLSAQQTFSVMASNTYWDATENENWFTILPSDNTSGNDGTTPIIVQVDANYTPYTRVGYIYINEDGGGLSQTVTIYQEPYNPCLNYVSLTSPNDDLGGTETKRAVVTIEATNQIYNGANIDYKAGSSILLQAGFKVDNGAVFKATIQNDPCND